MNSKERVINLFAPLKNAGKSTISTLSAFGRRHRLLKWPVFFVTVVYIFLYNIFYHAFLTFKLRDKLSRALALVMVMALVLTSVDLGVFAMEKEGEPSIIATVESFEYENTLEVGINTRENKLKLPEFVYANISYEEPVEKEETETVIEAVETSEEEALEVSLESVDETIEEQVEVSEETEQIIEKSDEISEESETPEVSEAQEESSEVSEHEEIVEEVPSFENEEFTEEQTPENEKLTEVEAFSEETPETEPEVTSEEEPEASIKSFFYSIASVFAPVQAYADELEDEIPEVTEEKEEVSETEETPSFVLIEEKVEIPVTWECKKYDRKNYGEYVFTAVLPEEFDGKTLDYSNTETPFVTVKVVEHEAITLETVVDGVVITMKADYGVFPENVTLFATKVESQETLDRIDESLENVQKCNVKSQTFTYDIKVFDELGNEIQPDTEFGTVSLYFEMAEISTDVDTVEVYHVSGNEELEAKLLESEIIGDMVVAETTGFSYYVVELVYGYNVSATLKLNEKTSIISLFESIDEFCTEDQILSIISADPTAVLVEKTDGKWYITALREFDEEIEINLVFSEGEPLFLRAVCTKQSVTFETKTTNDLVKCLLSDGIGATNFESYGSVSYFEDSDMVTGFEKGVILDTSNWASDNKDTDLANLFDSSKGAYYGGHTSLLQFEMVAQGDLLNFNFAFASTEFNQEPQYNDAFGLFVSVNGGAFENIAKLPDTEGVPITDRDVTIVNLRAGYDGTQMDSGSSTYITDGAVYDYFTAKEVKLSGGSVTNGVSNIFNAQKPVTKGDKVVVKFVIADATDTSCDSWVMIQAGSLSFKAPTSAIDYVNEALKDLEPGATFEITTTDDGNKYVIVADENGLIPLNGTDEGGNSYDFIGKNISIIQKGDGETGDSEPQEIEVVTRPEAEDPVAPVQNASKPEDVKECDISVTPTSITVCDSRKVPQQYSIDGVNWITPINGEAVFSDLTPNEEYVVKSRKMATTTGLSSDPSAGVTVKTMGMISVITNPGIATYDGKGHNDGVLVTVTSPENYTLTFSGAEDAVYTSEIPSFSKVGKSKIYFKVMADNCYDYYGTVDMVIEPIEVELEVEDSVEYLGTNVAPKAKVTNLLPGDTCEVYVYGEGLEVCEEGEKPYAAYPIALSNPNYKLPSYYYWYYGIYEKTLTFDNTSVSITEDGTIEVINADTKKYMYLDDDYTVSSEEKDGFLYVTVTGNGCYSGSVTKKIPINKSVEDGYVKTFIDVDQSVDEELNPTIEPISSEEAVNIVLDDSNALKNVIREYPELSGITKEDVLEFINAGDVSFEINVFLKMKEISEAALTDAEIKSLADKGFTEGYSIGNIMDLEMFAAYEFFESGYSVIKQVEQIHETSVDEIITISVPEGLKNYNPNIERTFIIVRMHNGEAEELASSTDNEFQFATNKYSKYFLLYKDRYLGDPVPPTPPTPPTPTPGPTPDPAGPTPTPRPTPDPDGGEEPVLPGKASPKTNDTTNNIPYILALIGGSAAMGTLLRKKK